MNQMELRKSRDVAFERLEGLGGGVSIKDLMKSCPELFETDRCARDYIRNLRNRYDSIYMKKRSGIMHFFIAPNLYNMFHFKLSKEKRV